jgi:hypothetical protein
MNRDFLKASLRSAFTQAPTGSSAAS